MISASVLVQFTFYFFARMDRIIVYCLFIEARAKSMMLLRFFSWFLTSIYMLFEQRETERVTALLNIDSMSISVRKHSHYRSATKTIRNNQGEKAKRIHHSILKSHDVGGGKRSDGRSARRQPRHNDGLRVRERRL